MGGDGYALQAAELGTPLVQLGSDENLARSSFARRVPEDVGEGAGWVFMECFEGCGACLLRSFLLANRSSELPRSSV